MTRKAFLVGINRYPDPRNNLKGCVNDVLLMAKTLREQFGFAGPTDIKLLTDERATTANIRKGLEWLVGDASPGDSLVFHYSGHGAQVRDVDGDELSDNLDEILCPCGRTCRSGTSSSRRPWRCATVPSAGSRTGGSTVP